MEHRLDMSKYQVILIFDLTMTFWTYNFITLYKWMTKRLKMIEIQ